MSPGESTDPCYLTELLHVAMQVVRDCDEILCFCATLHIKAVKSCQGYVKTHVQGERFDRMQQWIVLDADTLI